MNAYTEADVIVLDVARYRRLDFMTPRAARDPEYQGENEARLHRWRIDLRAGGVASEPLDDVGVEFPRVDERRVGRKHRFGYVAARSSTQANGSLPHWTDVRRYDLERGTTTARRFGAASGVGEPIFVPRHANAAEDDGYVLVLVYDHERNASDFLLLDAADIAGEPVARVRLPHRVPYGFHGNWAPA
jgi:carotenoid cleavage dioxygenase